MTAILPPDTRPIYSNLGFAVLGNVLAEMAGMPYDSLIHDTVIAPLGQTNTGVNMSKAPRSNLALPYTDSGSPCGAACLAVSWRGGDVAHAARSRHCYCHPTPPHPPRSLAGPRRVAACTLACGTWARS